MMSAGCLACARAVFADTVIFTYGFVADDVR